jgi:hypothetical protein
MTVYLSAQAWRILRRLLKRPGGGTFDQVRNWQRKDADRRYLAGLVEAGLVKRGRGGVYVITPRGVAAADLGEYEADRLPPSWLNQAD